MNLFCDVLKRIPVMQQSVRPSINHHKTIDLWRMRRPWTFAILQICSLSCYVFILHFKYTYDGSEENAAASWKDAQLGYMFLYLMLYILWVNYKCKTYSYLCHSNKCNLIWFDVFMMIMMMMMIYFLYSATSNYALSALQLL